MAFEEIGKMPVPGENPAGSDVRFEPEFEALENEFGKQNSLTASGIVDWEKVIEVSGGILANKSKDVLVACYLNIGLLKRDGIEGLATGMKILRDMLETFWETMYPPKKRLRGRINAIEWLSEKIEDAVSDLPHVTWSKEKRDAFVGNLNGIEEFLSTTIDDGPLIRTMITTLADLVDEEEAPEESVPKDDTTEKAVPEQTAPEEGEKPENISAQAPPPQQQAPPPARQVPPSTETGDESAGSLLKQGLGTLAGASALFMKQEQISPAAFKLNRFVGWFPVENVPPATDGKTMLPPPDAQVRSTLESLSRSQNWRELLTSAESRVRQFLFWLDLHRYVAEALDNLGYPVISQFVTGEAVSFVRRLPGIEKLSFSDGTPFADQETREWLKSTFTDGAESGASSSVDTGETGQLIANETEEARKLIKENKVGDALRRFRSHLNHAASGKERYVWELAFCRLLLRVKQPRLCQPYVKQILETLDTFNIEAWDPALALEGLAVVLTALQLQDESMRENELIENVINRISALDPSKALDYL